MPSQQRHRHRNGHRHKNRHRHGHRQQNTLKKETAQHSTRTDLCVALGFGIIDPKVNDFPKVLQSVVQRPFDVARVEILDEAVE